MTLKYILKKLHLTDVAYVEYRQYLPNDMDIFRSAASYKDGELSSFDDKTHSLSEKFCRYKKWLNANGQLCLTVWKK